MSHMQWLQPKRCKSYFSAVLNSRRQPSMIETALKEKRIRKSRSNAGAAFKRAKARGKQNANARAIAIGGYLEVLALSM